jgi:hypothetical protein
MFLNFSFLACSFVDIIIKVKIIYLFGRLGFIDEKIGSVEMLK